MDKEIIISRYKENVDWVLDSPYPVSLYNHGEPLDIDHPNIDVIDLPNKGREAGIWLEHIIRNYDNLASWSYFVQADPHQPISQFWKRLEVEYTDTTPLTTEYTAWHPPKEAKVKDKVFSKDGIEWHFGIADPIKKGFCDACAARCDQLWRQYFVGRMPDPWLFAYGAQYAVPSKCIKNEYRPLNYWRWLRSVVNEGSNDNHIGIHNAWSFELLWYYLWGPGDQYRVRNLASKEVLTPGVPGARKPCNCGKNRPKNK